MWVVYRGLEGGCVGATSLFPDEDIRHGFRNVASLDVSATSRGYLPENTQKSKSIYHFRKIMSAISRGKNGNNVDIFTKQTACQGLILILKDVKISIHNTVNIEMIRGK